jgi:hypothetical protein
MKVSAAGKEPTCTVSEGWVVRPALLLGNKCDVKAAMEGYRVLEARFKDAFPVLPISAKEIMNFEELKKELYHILDIVRVYTKAPGREPDYTEPVILRKNGTIEDVALSVHKDFAARLRYARVWGSGKFEGQMVKHDHRVNEGDVIELHL